MVTKGFQSGCNSSHQSLLKKKYVIPHLQIFFFLNKNFIYEHIYEDHLPRISGNTESQLEHQ